MIIGLMALWSSLGLGPPHSHPPTNPQPHSPSQPTPPCPPLAHPFSYTQHLYPSQALMQLYKELADIEYHLAAGASEKLQLGALVGAFAHAREILS